MADRQHVDVAEREQQRLATLREYAIMDSGREPAFDRASKMVASLFDAPIVLVSLIDECRQWFKSTHGVEAEETPRHISFCKHIISNDEPLIVTDVMADARFRDNPMVTGPPNIRFYAGVPLRAYNGDILGTLCIIDDKERADFDALGLERLEDFASIIMAEADLRRTVMERDKARWTLDRALDFSAIAVWQLDPKTDVVVWQGAAAELWGADVLTALTTSDKTIERIHVDDRDQVRDILGQAFAKGTPFFNEHRILHPERGVRWIAARGDWDVQNAGAMLTGVCIDVTEQKSRQENANLLMRELHHRMRNLFATVGAIISLTRHASHDVDDYVERINCRLHALNRAQNVLLGANFLSGSLHALLREVEAAFPRVRWKGPDLLLPENALVAMALVLNELATNATKHGALSAPCGCVEINWEQDQDDAESGQFRLMWVESGGDGPVGPPEQTSFGTLLIERSVQNNLGGTIERAWNASGLICTITLPSKWSKA